jgi:hypothetical protein
MAQKHILELGVTDGDITPFFIGPIPAVGDTCQLVVIEVTPQGIKLALKGVPAPVVAPVVTPTPTAAPVV